MTRAIALLFSALAAALPAAAASPPSHSEHFEHYEGTKTCLTCHQDEAEAFFRSKHYQWKAEPSNLVNAHGAPLGKLTMINDYCTNPRPNWIGEVRNADGAVLEQGCSKCHAGRGPLPSTEMSPAQLDNIDCLICHASGYRRDLHRNDDGSWEWKPILWKNREGLDSVAKRISRPTRAMCLRCHAGSGGGPNYKRGDIEYALADCEPEFDVHMASEGNDLQCVDCHAGADHRIPGPGADIAGDDLPSKKVSCDADSCHGSEPHGSAVLDRHTARVYCTACHIPAFAKENPTNIFRDWSSARWDEEKGKHTYVGELASNLRPVLAWYNGTSFMQLPGEKVRTTADGEIMVAVPQGSKDDPSSKLHAFKRYRAMMPVLETSGWILPIETGHFYRTGDMDAAVRRAAHDVYGLENVAFNWMPTVHYQGIFHEVQPAANALGCLDCHDPDGGLDWTGLGYEGDPLAPRLEPPN